MKIGYARVSTGDQNLDMQMDALNPSLSNKLPGILKKLDRQT